MQLLYCLLIVDKIAPLFWLSYVRNYNIQSYVYTYIVEIFIIKALTIIIHTWPWIATGYQMNQLMVKYLIKFAYSA